LCRLGAYNAVKTALGTVIDKHGGTDADVRQVLARLARKSCQYTQIYACLTPT